MKKKLLPLVFLAICLVLNKAEAQWTSLGSGINIPQRTLAGIAPVNENILWGFTWHASQFVPTHEYTRTTDGGQTWQAGSLTGVSSDQFSFYIFPLDGQTAWLSTADEKNPIKGKIYKTTDAGANWTHQATGFSGFNETPTGIYFWNANEGVAYGATGETSYNNQIAVYTTLNGGDQWTKVVAPNMPTQLPGEGQSLYNFAGYFSVVGDTVWFGTTKKRVFRSVDRGKSWQVFSTPLTSSNYISSIGFRNGQTGLALGYNPLKLARSEDGGQTWTLLPLTVPSSFRGAQIEYVPGTRSTWIMVAGPTKYMVSYNDGNTWETFDSNIEVWSMEFLNARTGFAASYITSPMQGGAYRWAGPPLGNRLFVNHDALGANNGASWADAYTDLKSALSAAQTGDEIWVAGGTYLPAAPGGSTDATFSISKNLRLLGGFAGTETSASQRDPLANPTILSGDLNGNDVDDDFSAQFRNDNVSHVVNISAAATLGSVLDGFTIQGGQADAGLIKNGGGINCFGAPAIRNCIFRQNVSYEEGAGLYVSGAGAQGLVVEHCRFEKNLAANTSGGAGGGGMYVSGLKNAGVIIRDCIFMDNTADWMGGLAVQNSNGVVEGTTFSGNFTKRHGGGLRVGADVGNDNLTFKVHDCTFQNNKASFGGGMYALIRSKKCIVEVTNTKFLGNAVEDMQLSGWSQSYGGLGFAFPPTASDIQVKIDSCLFEGNATSTNQSAIGLSSGGTNIIATLTNSAFRQNNCRYYATVGLWPESDNTLDATIENCLFENNISQYASAGLDLGPYLEGNDANYTVRNCVFRANNAALIGGTLTLWANKGSKATFNIEDCLMEGNSAGEHAGGVWILTGSDDFNARFDRCIFRNNDSPWGSAIGAYQLELTDYVLPVGAVVSIENSLLEGNTSSAAIVLDSFPGFRLINSTIAHNHGGIQVSDSSGLRLQNTILYNPGYAECEALSNDVSFISNGGNLIGDLSLNGQLLPSDKENLDPVFVGAGDYHLGMGSPGINHGVDLGNLSAVDLDGHARVVGSAVDIGAYEDQTVAVQELMADALMVSPNPADAFLTVQLPEEITGPFVIEVHNPEGKLLRSQTLISGQQLDVQGLAPGTYALKVLWNEREYAGKFVKQ